MGKPYTEDSIMKKEFYVVKVFTGVWNVVKDITDNHIFAAGPYTAMEASITYRRIAHRRIA